MNTHYKARAITSLLNDVAKQFPVVMITGPRQSGKSTLVQHVFPTYRYVTLKNPMQGLCAE
jgi:predicted AAA+ superfamily ATPase